MSTIKFSCPQCGNESFKVAAEPKSYEDFIGDECPGCGRALTDNDIKEQATAVAKDLLLDQFKGIKGFTAK